jgi:hypothetical protein
MYLNSKFGVEENLNVVIGALLVVGFCFVGLRLFWKSVGNRSMWVYVNKDINGDII